MAKIKFDNIEYDVDESVISAGKTNLASHVQNMSGSDSKVTINGTTYNVGGAAFTNSVTIIEGALNELVPGMEVLLSFSNSGDPMEHYVATVTNGNNEWSFSGREAWYEENNQIIKIDNSLPTIITVTDTKNLEYTILNGETVLFSKLYPSYEPTTYTIAAGTAFTEISFCNCY